MKTQHIPDNEMFMKKIYRTAHWALILIFCLMTDLVQAQFLSRLHAEKNDPLFTTYAAPLERSSYQLDQGYQLAWTDDESGVGFTSADGPNFGTAFSINGRLIVQLQEMYSQPVVTTSYSDLVRLYYYPEKHLKVDLFFCIYNSGMAFCDYLLSFEGHTPAQVTVLPYIFIPAGNHEVSFNRTDADQVRFHLEKTRDGWMKEHQIPFIESISGHWMITGLNTTGGTLVSRSQTEPASPEDVTPYEPLVSWIKQQRPGKKHPAGIIRSRSVTMQPGEQLRFRMVISLQDAATKTQAIPELLSDPESNPMDSLIRQNELLYAKIPVIKPQSHEKEMLYWSAFSLMRQCMMPPEGECRVPYYVFSREPKWGWGYGGQVFHESLAMLAYCYMDPAGAMNSQRVYMHRQREDGYINYRTGPWLNETIVTGGKPTTSAPWFNFINHEIYKVTKDPEFLKEAYQSGKKFYHNFVSQRDSNANGLCEWGAHAELESVRDARVAVWDKVGWASNFEGPDVNSMLVREAMSLEEMALALGKADEAREWEQQASVSVQKINQKMWDPATGFYFNVNRNDGSFSYKIQDDLKIREIIGFLPLWAGIPDREQAHLLVRNLLDTNQFWRRFGIPSLSAADPYYCPIGYWNGPVWVQWNYLIFRGLKEYGYYYEAHQLSNKVLDNMIHHLKKDHTFWEFYSADDYQAGWNRTYIWAGLAARFILDESAENP